MIIRQKKNGITLIALVVTIVVLLILAGVSIAMITGDNSIFLKAKQAKTEQIKAEMKEALILELMGLQTENEGKATLEDINQEWANIKLGEYIPTVKEEDLVSNKQIKMKKNNIIVCYTINEKLNIVEEKEIKEDELINTIELEKISNSGREVTLRINVDTKNDENDINTYYLYKNDELIYEGDNNLKKIENLNFNSSYTFKAKALDKNGNIKETSDLNITTSAYDDVYNSGKFNFATGFSDFNTSPAATDFTYGRNGYDTINGVTYYHLVAINIGISNITCSGIHTKEKVDLTNVNNIEFKVKLLNNYSSSSNYETKVYYGISNTQTSDYTNFEKYDIVSSTRCNAAEANCPKNGEEKTVSLDVSNYAGLHYIKVVVVHPAIKNYNYEAAISNIRLK